MWLLLALTVSMTSTYLCQDSERVVLLVRIPPQYSEDYYDGMQPSDAYYSPKDIYTNTKRAIPFNGGMYGKRGTTMPFSGGMYGKRASTAHLFAQRRSTIPFSGGMYGKRSAANSYNNYLDNENQIKRGAMPFSGGMYGR